MERDVKVEVWGRQVTISIYQRSKSVWIATGTYLDQTIEVKRPTSGAAVKGWVDAAKYKGG